MLFHVPFIIIMAVIIYSLSHKVRKGMDPFLIKRDLKRQLSKP
jgi:hypothetical protein